MTEVVKYFDRERICFLTATSKTEAFYELSRLVAPAVSRPSAEIYTAVSERESQISTYVGDGIAIPHAKLLGAPESVVAVGISRGGISWDGKDGELTRVVVFIVWNDIDHIQLLSKIARLFARESMVTSLLNANSADEVLSALLPTAVEPARTIPEHNLSIAGITFRAAMHMAREAELQAVLLYPDPLGTLSFLREEDFSYGSPPLFLITQDLNMYPRYEDYQFGEVVQLPYRGLRRRNLVEMSLIYLLSKSRLKKGDKVLNIFGNDETQELDTISYTDVERDFALFFSLSSTKRPRDLEEAVFSRIIQISGEIAEEGREGKPVGTLFVLGSHEEVLKHTQQLVINPFHGYNAEERNVLDPSLEETIKEFSRIDGAFIIRGDGVIMSAGTYVRTNTAVRKVPYGLGARHTAAAAITAVSDAVAIAISESTRKISIFSDGQRVMVF